MFDQLNRGTTATIDVGVSGTPAMSVTSTGFDIAGNTVRVVDARSNVVTMAYNNWGLMSSLTEPSTRHTPT